MGIRSTVVVCVTSFLLGSLFTHWIADSLTLWKSPVTDEHLWTAALYYSILTKGPPIIFYFLAAVVALGGVTILWSLGDGEAGNLMFDGGSIFLFATTVVLYLYSVIPIILAKFSTLPTHQLKDPFPGSLRSATLDLASNHLMCSVALTGVLILQAGRFWAERSDDAADVAELRREAALLIGRQSRAKTPDIKS
ncbi:Shr3 amino acid permease chaperone [Mycena rosella]|uniref:Shr3 amino acid permease chaperone n=1 Tax=Mycena rosella TaxID=1033263 RepID=A0AAD7H1Z9_MYCRO|nr:Shr3 amino acid permease chaperone [Mycena rosella]